ncbi:Gfo/Idh/MocA family protein [Phytohabitans suffuscus]|uniref:Oxidoreductase n=1 Tax=Phytohabitans suffuscus TaxID=624315 RepID=A0A6F8YX31_9ACTN|nr:Gfo/Idh/MocA family oxidoreductase [Phytohabitans suffuscus]BCB90498.1 oxidoreductase [Phytohabitans suffuscus]
MAQRSYRTAIVGTGGIAGAHARAVRDSGRGRLVAAVDVDTDRARAFAAEWDVPRVSASLSEVLRAEDLDLVHVCTPPGTHAGLAGQCLAAGVTALVEKPPVVSLAELDGLVDAERGSGASVATVFQQRFGPGAGRLRRMAAAGDLGRPLVATCLTQWYRDDAYFAVPWRGSWRSEGGGPTMGHGIHQFDLLLSVLGPWREVTAVAARQARRVDTEDVSMALVTFENGAVATVVNSVLSPRQVTALRFDYEHATVELEHLYSYTDADWRVTPAPGHEAVAARWAAAPVPGGSGHSGQLAAVYRALDDGEPPPVTLAGTRPTVEFVAALYASAFTGERVRAGAVPPAFAARMDGTGPPWR